ncbi:Scr1 family TA system antitoxin-like transcriptional regulator [Actinophytocola sp.]
MAADATSVSNHEADVVPRLLQCEGYARAVIPAFTPCVAAQGR